MLHLFARRKLFDGNAEHYLCHKSTQLHSAQTSMTNSRTLSMSRWSWHPLTQASLSAAAGQMRSPPLTYASLPTLGMSVTLMHARSSSEAIYLYIDKNLQTFEFDLHRFYQEDVRLWKYSGYVLWRLYIASNVHQYSSIPLVFLPETSKESPYHASLWRSQTFSVEIGSQYALFR